VFVRVYGVAVATLLPLVTLALAVSAVAQNPASAAPGKADSSTAALRFQVATIKPSLPEETRTMQIRGNRFATTDTTLIDLLKYAYGLQEQEIAGGPKWLKAQAFDLMADPETQARPTSPEFKTMVQNLLADRFHLTAHKEMRELAVYVIVPAKGGSKLTPTTNPASGFPVVGYQPGHLGAANATVGDFATFLQRFVSDRPVVDGTGIRGKYDWSLQFTPDDAQPEVGGQGDAQKSSFPGLFTAMQEQLGLKLQEEKRPSPVFVIDSAEMPSEN
jgi:uncharacterized protein (TIGR03435 family)